MRGRTPARRLLDVVDSLYEALLSAELWPLALARMAGLFDARAAGLRVEDRTTGVRQHWTGLEPSFERAYVDHYWRHDPWAGPLECAPVGTVAYGDAIASRQAVEKSAFHNDLARPYGLGELAGGILERSATQVVSFGIMMPAGRRFAGGDEQILGRLAPHVRRALTLAERLAAPSSRGRSEALSTDLRERLEGALQRQFGLTSAEACVAAQVGRGLAPKEIALARRTSWHTVRAQLRQILAKMEVRSQSALAHEVTRLEACLSHDMARGIFHER